MTPLKGQSHKIFDPRVFLLNCTPGSPDSWAKTVLHIDSNSRRYSIKLYDEYRWVNSALCCIVGSHDSALCRIAGSPDSALCGIAWGQFFSSNRIELLREFESIIKTALAHESGDTGVLFNEKSRVENLVRLSLY
jgi:hypothetical protein